MSDVLCPTETSEASLHTTVNLAFVSEGHVATMTGTVFLSGCVFMFMCVCVCE